MTDIQRIFASLGVQTEGADLYLKLLAYSPMPVGLLAKKVGIARSSLYGTLEKLVQKGLVIETQKNGVKLFTAENPDKILREIENKITDLQDKQEAFKKILPSLKKHPKNGNPPKLKFFENSESLARSLNEMLLYENIETWSVWPQKQMVKVLGKEFFWHHNKERIKNNIQVKAIWPKNQMVDIHTHPYFGSGPLFKREIRIVDGADFSLGYWIFNQTVIFISSTWENFGFVVESQELCDTLKAQFNFVWDKGIPLITSQQDTREFLDNLKV